MKKFSVSELKKAIVAAEAERLQIGQPFRPAGPKLQRNRAAFETMGRTAMENAGLDLNKLRGLQEQREAEMQRLGDRHKREALRVVTRRKNKLGLAAQGRALAEAAARGNIFLAPSFVLDTPFLIWSTPQLPVNSSAAPLASWAKFRFLTSQSGDVQKVSFYFYWVNHTSEYAVISAATSLTSSGYLRAHAPWGLGVNTSVVQAWAWFGLWFGVTSDLNPADYVKEYLGEAGAFASFFGGSDVEDSTVWASSGLSRAMFAVPPGNVVVFEVALAIEYNNDSGNIEADFESGDFQIACPVVVFSVLNPQAAGGGVG